MSTVIRVGPQPETLRAPAVFLDGRLAAARATAIEIVEARGGPELVIRAPGLRSRHWPLAALRRVPDGARRDELILRVDDDPVARLVVSEPEAVSILLARCTGLDRRAPLRRVPALIGWAGAAIASVALIVFVLVPVMANQLAEYLPAEGEKALGDSTFEQIRRALAQEGSGALRVCDAPAGTQALQAMSDRLTATATLPYPIRVHVLDHELVNAFALPGGHIVFFRGLIDAADRPEEVAAVFAHEIGHVLARDPTRIALRTAGSVGVLGLLLGDFAGGAVVLFLTERLIQATYSRDAEAGADVFAHQSLIDADVRPSALADMFRTLRDKAGEGNALLAHFASHPELGDRIAAAEAADARLTGPPRPVLDAAGWRALQKICK